MVLAPTPAVRYCKATPRARPAHVNALANLIFPYFLTTLALGAAFGEWVLWCWFRGAPHTLLPYVVWPAVLFGVNRLAAAGCQREPATAPVLARVGTAVLGLGFTAFAGASALGVVAMAWTVLEWVVAVPTPAGAAEGFSAAASILPAFRPIGMAAIAAGVGTMSHGYLRGHRRLRIVRLDLPIAGLPAALDGFSI